MLTNAPWHCWQIFFSFFKTPKSLSDLKNLIPFQWQMSNFFSLKACACVTSLSISKNPPCNYPSNERHGGKIALPLHFIERLIHHPLTSLILGYAKQFTGLWPRSCSTTLSCSWFSSPASPWPRRTPWTRTVLATTTWASRTTFLPPFLLLKFVSR